MGVNTIGEVMIPRKRMVQVGPQTDFFAALLLMDNNNVAQQPVTESGLLLGLLSREQVLHCVRMRSELGF